MSPFVAGVMFAALAAFRAWSLEKTIGFYSGCRGCFWLPSLGHDAWLMASMLGLLAVGYLATWSWLGVIARVGACLLLLIFAGDIATNTLLAQRLYWGDVLRFGKHAGNDLSVIRAALGSRSGMIATALGVVALLASTAIVFASRNARTGKVALLAAIACAFGWLYTAMRPVHYVHDVFLDNVIEANFTQGRVAPFSASFIEAQRTLAEVAPRQCTAGEQTRGSVIVLIVESLSSWQSRLLGGAQDWMPRLDEIARSNHYISQFHANGFTTSAAEIAVLSGHMPLIPPGRLWFEYTDYADGAGSLPDIAHRSGRDAAFFTTGDLSFLGLGDWLHQLGFDVIGGSKDAFYAGRQRWQFDAADDESLYARFLEWLDQRDPGKPFVSAMMTVSSHPRTSTHALRESMRKRRSATSMSRSAVSTMNWKSAASSSMEFCSCSAIITR